MDERYEVWADWQSPDGKSGGSKPMAYICKNCGSLVVDRTLHDDWHQAHADAHLDLERR